MTVIADNRQTIDVKFRWIAARRAACAVDLKHLRTHYRKLKNMLSITTLQTILIAGLM